MNEKYLWELWDKCTHPHPVHGGKDMGWPMEFAELIIRTCANIADDTGDGEPTYGWMAGDNIMKHFGVDNET